MEKYSIKLKDFSKKYGVINLVSEKTSRAGNFVKKSMHLFDNNVENISLCGS